MVVAEEMLKNLQAELKLFNMFNIFKKETTEKKDILVILDNGHGVETQGKRSPKWPDGSQLFEYEFNRDVVKLISEKLTQVGIKNIILVPELKDVPLQDRVNRANKLWKSTGKKCFGVSIHANAGKGTGWEVWTSVGKTKSDDIATIFWEEMKTEFPQQKMRLDTSDGDVDKESDFYILKKTNCPFILTENFFMDTYSDYKIISSQAGRQKIANAHVRAIKKVLMKLY